MYNNQIPVRIEALRESLDTALSLYINRLESTRPEQREARRDDECDAAVKRAIGEAHRMRQRLALPA